MDPPASTMAIDEPGGEGVVEPVALTWAPGGDWDRAGTAHQVMAATVTPVDLGQVSLAL